MNTLIQQLARIALVSLTLAALPAAAQPVRLAAPGFNAVNLDPAIASFYAEHFAQQLSLRQLSVVTAAEITALIGLERQRHLLGCEEDASSCLAELSNALGVDGIVTGSVGKLGKTLQANIKIIRSTDGSTLSLISRTAASEDALFDALTEASALAASDVLSRLRPGTQAAVDAERAGLAPTAYRVRRAHLVTVDLLALLYGAYAIEYERVLIPFVSVTVRPALLMPHVAPAGVGGELGVGARLFPWGRAPHGFWAGLETRGNYLSRPDASGMGFAVSVALGWNWVSEDWPITAGLAFAGGGYLTAFSPHNLGVDVRLTGAVGVPF